MAARCSWRLSEPSRPEPAPATGRLAGLGDARDLLQPRASVHPMRILRRDARLPCSPELGRGVVVLPEAAYRRPAPSGPRSWSMQASLPTRAQQRIACTSTGCDVSPASSSSRSRPPRSGKPSAVTGTSGSWRRRVSSSPCGSSILVWLNTTTYMGRRAIWWHGRPAERLGARVPLRAGRRRRVSRRSGGLVRRAVRASHSKSPVRSSCTGTFEVSRRPGPHGARRRQSRSRPARRRRPRRRAGSGHRPRRFWQDAWC